MTGEPRNATVWQERREMPSWAVYAFAAGLAILLVSCAVVTWIAEAGAPAHTGWRAEAAPVQRVPREIEGVDQSLFSAHLPSRGDWTVKQRDLSRYEWKDNSHQAMRIPIERAMDLLVERGHVE